MKIDVAKQERQVRQVEVVETYNLSRSIARLMDCSYTESQVRWKRALYHALGMASIDRGTLERLRQAIGLP